MYIINIFLNVPYHSLVGYDERTGGWYRKNSRQNDKEKNKKYTLKQD